MCHLAEEPAPVREDVPGGLRLQQPVAGARVVQVVQEQGLVHLVVAVGHRGWLVVAAAVTWVQSALMELTSSVWRLLQVLLTWWCR